MINNSVQIGDTQSKLNRFGRRVEKAQERHAESDARRKRAEDQKDKVKEERHLAHVRRQEASHARAVLRKEKAKPKSQTKAELKAAQKLLKKVEAKRSRQLKYLRKIQKHD